MVSRPREQHPPEHVAVGLVEEILKGAAERHPTASPAVDGRPRAARALWICACVSMDDGPTWLIYEDTTGGIAWSRLADTHKCSDVVDAPMYAGGHADPAMVLRWLTGERSDPWGNGGSGQDDDKIVEALAAKLAVH